LDTITEDSDGADQGIRRALAGAREWKPALSHLCRLAGTSAHKGAVCETPHETVRSKQEEIAPETSQERFLV
ncbi:MAG TPA: hypothetical protein VLO00_08025, partial [Cryobacterium sp.]|nr:hypothetical protein [Cryobacterium sp.]